VGPDRRGQWQGRHGRGAGEPAVAGGPEGDARAAHQGEEPGLAEVVTHLQAQAVGRRHGDGDVHTAAEQAVARDDLGRAGDAAVLPEVMQASGLIPGRGAFHRAHRARAVGAPAEGECRETGAQQGPHGWPGGSQGGRVPRGPGWVCPGVARGRGWRAGAACRVASAAGPRLTPRSVAGVCGRGRLRVG